MANHQGKCKVYKGWHSSPTGSMGISNPEMSTEGVGYYLAFDKADAEAFGRKVSFAEVSLCNPLDAIMEEPYILNESDEPFKPPRKRDSVWLSSIKEAVKLSGTTEQNFNTNQACLNQTLTDILQAKGHDGILIENWAVEFSRPRDRKLLSGCKS